MALLILVAAIAFAALARSDTTRISAADNPATTASPHSLSIKAEAKNGRNGRTRGSRSAAAEPPAITKAEAGRVLATYWRQNNIANQLRSDALLAAIEAGGSYQMDTGTYRMDRATDPANHDYAPFGAGDAVYYLPREPGGVYPHWFAVRVRYADLASPRHATGAGYVLTTQPANGAAWKNLLEPYLLTGSGPAPFAETDAEGKATGARLTGNDPNLSVPPGQIQQATAASLDAAADTVKNPGNPTDLQDQASFRPGLPEGSADTDTHDAPGPVFGLKTADGGALMFYGLTARLSLAPPPGGTFKPGIPGYYPPSQTLTSANDHLRRPVRDLHPPPPGQPPRHRRRLRPGRLRPATRKALSAAGAVRVQEPDPRIGPPVTGLASRASGRSRREHLARIAGMPQQ